MKEILQLTDKMLEAAEKNNWEHVENLEKERVSRLETIDIHPGNNNHQELMTQIKLIYRKNQDLMRISETRYNQIKAEIHLLRLSKQVNGGHCSN